MSAVYSKKQTNKKRKEKKTHQQDLGYCFRKTAYPEIYSSYTTVICKQLNFLHLLVN